MTAVMSCGREAAVSAPHSKSPRLTELQDDTASLRAELVRLRIQNKEVDRLKADNVKLQERNLELAADLALKSREIAKLKARQQDNQDTFRNASFEHKTDFSRQLSHEMESDCSSDLPNNLPGDSYPAVANSLDIIDSDHEEGDLVLAKLWRGGSRMEQIKRQCVAQRGAIVAALKMMADLRDRKAAESQHMSNDSGNSSQELDRGLTSLHVRQTVGGVASPPLARLCPMCEAMFPSEISQEEFEQHVMEHFNYDSDPDTLQYVKDS